MKRARRLHLIIGLVAATAAVTAATAKTTTTCRLVGAGASRISRAGLAFTVGTTSRPFSAQSLRPPLGALGFQYRHPLQVRVRRYVETLGPRIL